MIRRVVVVIGRESAHYIGVLVALLGDDDLAEVLGATHVLVHQRGARDAREAVEADLLASLRPVLNGPMDASRAVTSQKPQAKVVSFPSFSFAPPRVARA